MCSSLYPESRLNRREPIAFCDLLRKWWRKCESLLLRLLMRTKAERIAQGSTLRSPCLNFLSRTKAERRNQCGVVWLQLSTLRRSADDSLVDGAHPRLAFGNSTKWSDPDVSVPAYIFQVKPIASVQFALDKPRQTLQHQGSWRRKTKKSRAKVDSPVDIFENTNVKTSCI